MGKLINRIQGSRFLYQVYQARLRQRMSNCSTSLAILQAFLKLCLVNLISKDTHLVFSIYTSKWSFHINSMNAALASFIVFR